ncbi:efflux RND transporter periplasmic adaptor subunit [Aeromonas hydrophila]|uniref:efflux RND transporter periplasmic adaptor subunit n=1 Tax=Aeromonas hydrophila TaxID=644 RepID=UPI001E0FA6AD|nr:efflux RND transporter periplasmic adaptor subunit [Aeromonas hydrophila]EHK5438267.1 efflux RND transporter periplasmic adaptor subunit [Aeromonas hydrophila]UUT58516.1 efflux RND transporter periplasmic adaptor subunit [Aeromonas hydrophila]
MTHGFTRMVVGAALLAGGVLPALAQGKMVTLADVTRGEAAASIWVSGTVASRQQAALSAEVSGRVEWIAEFGSRVSKGDELLRLDSAALRLSLEQAQAEQAKWESNVRFARAEFGRLATLHRQKSTSQSQYDKARYDVEQAELAERLARVQVRQIEEQLRRSHIFAPFDGVVNNHFIQPGEHVDAGEQALELVNPDQPDIRLQAPIVWAGQLAPQTRLRVEGEQLSGHGVYYQRAASADPKSRLIELRLKPEAGRFIIGSPVRVALPLAEQQTMLLPRDALVLNTEGSVVYQVEQRGEVLTVNRVPVTVLFGDSRQVAVSGALKQGDRVVVRGAGSLQDGDKVELFRG